MNLWQYIKKKKQILGEFSIAIPIGTVKESKRKNEVLRQSVKRNLGSENSLISLVEIWI